LEKELLMKRVMLFLAVVVLFGVSQVRAAMLEDWTDESGSNTGSFQDTLGSKMAIDTDAGPTAAQKSLKLTFTLASANGFCGIWHNLANDFSKETYLTFTAKAATAGKMGIALKDKYNVQYVTTFPMGTNWTQVVIPFASFVKDPYYTPSDAVTGHAMDLSHTTSMNFQASSAGANVLWIGPMETGEGAAPVPAAGAAAAAPSSSSSASGGAVVVQDFSSFDDKSGGTFQDSKGSSFTFKTKDNTNKPGSKFLVVSYNLASGGYCGMWCMAGNGTGLDLSAAKTFNLLVYTKAPIAISLALKDKNNNQYAAVTPVTKGGVWETLSVPMSSFTLDPNYAPPDAIKGAPMDFSKVPSFNLQAKTEGQFGFAVASVIAK
jgi:hypothetical protein